MVGKKKAAVYGVLGAMMAILTGSPLWAGLPQPSKESFQRMVLNEKNALEAVVLEYDAKIEELEGELLFLQQQKEWSFLKMVRIRDYHRDVPYRLEKSQQELTLKIQAVEQEKDRLRITMSQHIERLKQLNQDVKKKFSKNASTWWQFHPRVAELMGLKIEIASSSLISSDLQQELEEKIRHAGIEKWLEIKEGESGLELSNSLPILFATGKASLNKEYKDFFYKLADVIAPYPVKIKVEGHADKRKIKTKKYPSNWELAAARASTVANLLIQRGIPSSSINVVSHGSSNPKAPEEEGKGNPLNRRIELKISFQEG